MRSFILGDGIFLLWAEFPEHFSICRAFLRVFRPSGGPSRILLEKLCRIITSRPEFYVFSNTSRATYKTMAQSIRS